MNAALFDVSDTQNPVPLAENGAYHAVAITGFSLGCASATAYPGTSTLLRSSRIDELYVHDDQIGPFARMEFGKPAKTVNGKHKPEQIGFTLGSSWRGAQGTAAPGTVLFAPIALIVPLYHKIRIRFDSVLHWVLQMDAEIRSNAQKQFPQALEWDIFLTTGAEVKSDVRASVDVDSEQKWRVLERPLPRFVWRATGCVNEAKLLDVLFDATDIGSGDFVLDCILYAHDREGTARPIR